MGFFSNYVKFIDPLKTRKMFGGGKGGDDVGNFEFQPYSGHRPPLPKYTRETEDLYKNLIFNRAQGNDVGFDPKRTELLVDLVKSQIGQQEEDQLRSAQGAVSRSGLSGNPRAYEALAGRVKRDSGRQLADSLSKISIEDLTRRNEERDVNTERLGNFNLFNFGQENNRAGFDLDTYNSEQGNRLAAENLNNNQANIATNRRNELFSDIGGLVTSGISLASGNPAPAIIYAGDKLLNSSDSGKGIAPQNDLNTPSYYRPQSLKYRNLVR